jgi:ribonuclease HI
MSVIEVFTDGSCIKRKNGVRGIFCGYGIYFPNGELPNISRIFRHVPLTNQRAELYAIYVALVLIKKNLQFDKINIYSDSMYSINSITVWAKAWEKNNWKTSQDEPVKNQDIIKPLYNIYLKLKDKITFQHISSHTGKQDYISMGNEMADKLATEGSRK